jgi:hypothetical protein
MRRCAHSAGPAARCGSALRNRAPTGTLRGSRLRAWACADEAPPRGRPGAAMISRQTSNCAVRQSRGPAGLEPW